MASDVTIKCTGEGKPLEVLADLIKKREQALGESSRDACIATAINVVTSLKSMTRKAPLRANRSMYFNVVQTGLTAGWEKRNGKMHRVARSGVDGHVNRTVTHRCRNLAGQHYVKGEFVGVWKFQLANENLNETLYYCFAKNEKQVRDYAEKVILARLLKKESGMAKYALGVAQAKLSTRNSSDPRPSGANPWRIAHEAAKIIMGGSPRSAGSGTFFVEVRDDLKYSLMALKGGQAAMDLAVKKAANKTAGLITRAWANNRFSERVDSPFPEVKQKR